MKRKVPSQPKKNSENYLKFVPQLEELDVSYNRLYKLGGCLNPPLKKISFIYANHNNIGKITSDLCKNKNLSYLDIHVNPIREVPKSIAMLSLLKSLNISSCKITKISKKVGMLYRLGTLRLNNNRLKKFNVDLSQMTELSHLDLSSNRFEEFPTEIFTGTRLEFLDLSRNNISTIPDQIESLKNLHSLNLNSTLINNLPNEIVELKTLLRISARFTKIGPEPPKILFKIRSLQVLDLTGCELTKLTKKFNGKTFPSLEELYLAYNKLTVIPKEIKTLKKPLSKLWLIGNPLKNDEEKKIADLSQQALICKIFDVKAKKKKSIFEHQLLNNKRNTNENESSDNNNNDENINENKEINEMMEVDLLSDSDEDNVNNNSNISNNNNNKKKNNVIQEQIIQISNEKSVIKIPRGVSMLSTLALKDKIKGTIIGCCIGDAFALATYGMTKREAAEKYQFGAFYYENIITDNLRSRWENGDWTDDADQMILIILSILDNQGLIKPRDFASKLFNWSKNGFSELNDPDNYNVPLGATLSKTLRNPDFLKNPHKISKKVYEELKPKSAGNGAIMRTAILGIPHFYDLDKVREQTIDICRVTHYDPRCSMSCLVITYIIAYLCQGESNINKIIQHSIEKATFGITKEKYIQELKKYCNATTWSDLELDDSITSRYTFKAMGSGILSLKKLQQNEEWDQILTEVIFQGGDTNANGAISGALIGCAIGFSGFRESHLLNMPHLKWLELLVERLFQLMF
ncbi:hypothetical protein M0813_16800 [Anaeramoeba flamelloides]|uniref:ADP-ribosylglycohydrolase n=1 Tax=Anaeramoeba flamelloides TaxID=1746091 RepID=A0ABQ8YYK1_9EUKA|nr:hypothetical protein M0813_16800 [Anaeramoeba flamelloides]